MARGRDQSSGAQKKVRDAVLRGGPLPFVPSQDQRGESQRAQVGNPVKQGPVTQRETRVDVNVLRRVLAGAKRKK